MAKCFLWLGPILALTACQATVTPEPPAPVEPPPPPPTLTLTLAALGPRLDPDTQAIFELAPSTTERVHLAPGRTGYRCQLSPRAGAFQAKAFTLAQTPEGTFKAEPVADSLVTVAGEKRLDLQATPAQEPAVTVLELTNPGTLPLNLTLRCNS